MLHEIKIKKDYYDSNLEGDVTKKISKERFYAEMQDYNISIKYLLENYKTDFNYVANFNHFLRVVKQNHQISICESILILQEDDHDLKKLRNILSSEMTTQLEKELQEKYKLKKTEKSFIDNYFIF